MHKHFKILAISELLRNHGIDPETHPHTRLPGIWKKLAEYYNLDMADEIELSMDPPDEPGRKRRYKDFSLPWAEFGELILDRVRADASEAPSSPAQWDPDQPADEQKRKLGTAGSSMKSRSSTAGDTGDEESAPSPAKKSARGARSVKRAASKAKAKKGESSEAESAEEQDSGDADEEEPEEEETGTPASKTSRGGTRGRGGARGRARGRGRGRA
jgi:Chromatin modification-related protein EAF7